MHIVCINAGGLAAALQKAGHQTSSLTLPPGLTALPPLLKKNNIHNADLLVQHETLGQRVLLGGLEALPFPTVFIAVDSHLNLYWQAHYARLFDLVAAPHPSLFQNLPEELRPPAFLPFAHTGVKRPWRPHAERANILGLCARLGPGRPLRQYMTRLLQAHFPIKLEASLSYPEMLNFYGNTRLVPNECIAAELNFRMFEGASCGALVFSPDIGDDQNRCFEPNREFIPYSNGLELLELLAFYSREPARAEQLALAGWKRLNAEHLPEHRAATLLRHLPQSRARAEGPEAAARLWFTLYHCARSGAYPEDAQDLLRQAGVISAELARLAGVAGFAGLARLEGLEGLEGPNNASSDALGKLGAAERAALQLKAALEAACLSIMAESLCPGSPFHSPATLDWRKEKLREACLLGLQNPLFAHSVIYNSTASAVALRLNDFRLAKSFWLRHSRLEAGQPATSPARPAGIPVGRLPRTPAELGRFWATALQKAGYAHQAGFPFKPGLHIPACALEWLLEMPENAPALQEFYRNHPPFAAPAFELAHARLAAEAENWRVEMEFGLAALKAFQVEAGLEALRQAAQKARAAGRDELFRNMLARNPALRYI